MKLIEYFDKIITNNTGKSSKTFGMVVTIIMSSMVMFIICIVLIVDLFTNYKVETDLYGIASLIASIGGLLVATIYGKVQGEKYERKQLSNEEDLLLKK